MEIHFLKNIANKDLRVERKSLLPFILVLILCISPALSYSQDTLIATRNGESLEIKIKAQQKDDINTISGRYNVPLSSIVSLNNVNYTTQFSAGQNIRVPVVKSNYKRVEEQHSVPLAYIVKAGDKLQTISHIIGVAQSALQLWNRLPDQQITPGQKLFLGWVSDYDVNNFSPQKEETASIKPQVNISPKSDTATKTNPVKNKIVDTMMVDSAMIVVSPEERYADSVSDVMEDMYKYQLAGMDPQEQSGATAFYTVKNFKPGIFFAFHNSAAKGTVIKITNPSSGKTVYAKVIGTIPPLPEYNNCVMVLSGNAAAALGARYKKSFCKLQYR